MTRRHFPGIMDMLQAFVCGVVPSPDLIGLESALSLSDEQLCEQAKSNLESASSILISRYMTLAGFRVKKYKLLGIEPEDLVQDALIGLLKAIRGYDPSKGAAFSTFACTCIDRSIISAVKRAMARKNIPADRLVSLDDGDGRLEEQLAALRENNPQNLLEAKEAYSKLQYKLKSLLSALEYDVLTLYLYGRSYTEIAAQLGINSKTVDNALQRVRSKLR